MKAKKWCRHIAINSFDYYAPDSIDYCFKIRGELYFVPRSWKLCPICGATHPKRKVKENE